MKNKFILLFFLLSVVFINKSVGQSRDSTLAIGGITGDSLHIIHENIPKSKFWGNSWYFATSYNFSKTNEFDLNFGRTYGSSFCSGGGCIFNLYSWGTGFGLTTKNGETNQIIKAFGEYNFFYFPPLSIGLRGDYIYNITNSSHYIRPSVGFSFLILDLLYNYSFKIAGTENTFKHGITLRIKYFHKAKNWTQHYPDRC